MKAENITIKLFLLRQEIGTISKDSTNPFFKSKYFDINTLIKQLNPYLNKHKILLIQPIINNEVVTLLQCIEDNSFKTSSLELSKNLDAQKKGSEITYFRRYTLGSLLGLEAVDDDGNLASKPSLPNLIIGTPKFKNAQKGLQEGKSIQDIKKIYTVSTEVQNELLNFKLNK